MQEIGTDFGIKEALDQLGVKQVNDGSSTGSEWFSGGEILNSYSPVDGNLIGSVKTSTREDYDRVMDAATSAFKTWRVMPAPQRGEVVRQFGERLRELKEPLGKLVLKLPECVKNECPFFFHFKNA